MFLSEQSFSICDLFTFFLKKEPSTQESQVKKKKVFLFKFIAFLFTKLD